MIIRILMKSSSWKGHPGLSLSLSLSLSYLLLASYLHLSLTHTQTQTLYEMKNLSPLHSWYRKKRKKQVKNTISRRKSKITSEMKKKEYTLLTCCYMYSLIASENETNVLLWCWSSILFINHLKRLNFFKRIKWKQKH